METPAALAASRIFTADTRSAGWDLGRIGGSVFEKVIWVGAEKAVEGVRLLVLGADCEHP